MDLKSSDKSELDNKIEFGKTIADNGGNNKARFLSPEVLIGILLSSCLFFILIALHFHVAAPKTLSAQPVDHKMEASFWNRDWAQMDSVKKSQTDLTSKDLSLYVNALWIQGRYQQGLEILEDAKAVFPQELAPYAGMLRVLGYERTGRKQEAYTTAKGLWGDSPPSLRYYLSYALGRLTKADGKDQESLAWFRKMRDVAEDRNQTRRALEEIIQFPAATLNEAADLLILSPHHASAFKKIRSSGRAMTPRAAYALGYNAYIRRNYNEAIKWFALGGKDSVYGEAARYYKAYSHYRLKENGEALSLWRRGAIEGDEYPQRSVQRMRALASRGYREAVADALQQVIRSRDDEEVVAEALVSLIALTDGEQQNRAESELLRRYPKSVQAATRYWEKGLHRWKQKDAAAALEMWRLGSLAEPRDFTMASRLYYWQIRALVSLNRMEEANVLSKELQARYPFEYYSLLLNPHPDVLSASVSSQDWRAGAGLLEDWGFISYARADFGRSQSAESFYRSARLARWSGDYPASARQATLFLRKRDQKIPLTREVAECLHPKAFETEVRAASSKTGLPPSVIWGIMRQESMFEPHVVSSAGAYGLMQLMPATARGESKRMKLDADLYRKPAGNVLLGANHMVGLIAGFKEMPLAIAAYNAGGTPVKRWSKEGIGDMQEWIEAIPYNETRNYVKAVMGNIYMYRALYGDAKPVSSDIRPKQ